VTNYIKKYADCFNLLFKNSKCYDQSGNLVLMLHEEGKYIYYLYEPGRWLKGKNGDMAVSIINQVPLHVQQG